MDIQSQNSWSVFLIPVSSVAMAVRPRVRPLRLRLPQVPLSLQQHYPLLLHLHHSWHRLREVTTSLSRPFLQITQTHFGIRRQSWGRQYIGYSLRTISDNYFWLRETNWQFPWFHASDCQLIPRQRFIFFGSRAIEHPVLEVSSKKRVKTSENMSDFQNFFTYLLRGQLSSPNLTPFWLKRFWWQIEIYLETHLARIQRCIGRYFARKFSLPLKGLSQTPPVLTLFLGKPFAFNIFFESPINFAQALLLELCLDLVVCTKVYRISCYSSRIHFIWT